MFNFLNRLLPTPYEKRMTALVAMIILLVGVSLTTRLLDEEQDIRQRASDLPAGRQETTTQINTPISQPLEISSSPSPIQVVTINPLATAISISVTLSGVTAPVSPTRQFNLDIFDASGNFVTGESVSLTFQNSAYSGIANIGNLQTGNYTFKIKTPGFLESSIISLPQLITKGEQLSLPRITLTPGDINGDGLKNSLDYNILNDCYEGLTPARSCDDPAKKDSADLNADGKVDTVDYNILLRNLSQ